MRCCRVGRPPCAGAGALRGCRGGDGSSRRSPPGTARRVCTRARSASRPTTCSPSATPSSAIFRAASLVRAAAGPASAPARTRSPAYTCTRTQRTPAEPPCGPVAARCACRVLPCVQRWYRGCADGARRRGVGGGVLPRELRGVFVGLLLPPQSAAARACCAGPDQAVRAQSTCDGTCGGNR